MGDAKDVAKRTAVLDKVRAQLLGDQPPRKRVRKPTRTETTLIPGDVLAYKATSGRHHLLVVRDLESTRIGLWPIVELLDYAETEPPTQEQLPRLPARRRGRIGQPDSPAEPWTIVAGIVHHRRAQDYHDRGFALIGRVPPDANEQTIRQRSYLNWSDWHDYLEKQDTTLGERLTTAPER